jgi:ribose transport system permease protein
MQKSKGRIKDIKAFNWIINDGRIVFVLIGIIAIVALLNKNFLSFNNLLNISRQVAVIGIMSCGMTFVLITGNIDLSVGSILSLTGLVTLTIVKNFDAPLIAILVAIVIGLSCGLLNGFLINRHNGSIGSSFIITFGTMTIIGAAALLSTNGHNVTTVQNETYSTIGKSQIGMIPLPFLILLVVAIILQLILSKTTFGRNVSFTGANIVAARMSGINVNFYRYGVFMISGLCASLAAIVMTARVGSAATRAGAGFELDAIAAVVIGGVSLAGGSGKVWQTLIGALIMGVLANAMLILNLTEFTQLIVKGVIIILAVFLSSFSKNKLEARE